MNDDPARWLFKECPNCGQDFTAQDKWGVWCTLGCGWKLKGEEAEKFVKEADEESAGR